MNQDPGMSWLINWKKNRNKSCIDCCIPSNTQPPQQKKHNLLTFNYISGDETRHVKSAIMPLLLLPIPTAIELLWMAIMWDFEARRNLKKMLTFFFINFYSPAPYFIHTSSLFRYDGTNNFFFKQVKFEKTIIVSSAISFAVLPKHVLSPVMMNLGLRCLYRYIRYFSTLFPVSTLTLVIITTHYTW